MGEVAKNLARVLLGVSRKHRPQTADLENTDLENTDLENADLKNTDLAI